MSSPVTIGSRGLHAPRTRRTALRAARRPWGFASIAALVTVGVVLFTGAKPAQAGTYTIGDCPSAFNHTNSAGPWQFFGHPPPGAVVKSECDGETPVLVFGMYELPSTPLGFRATTAGTHLSIVDARVWWRAFGSPSGEVEAETEVTNASGEPVDIGQADGSGELFEQMTTPEEWRIPAEEHATTLKLAEHCYPEGKCPMTESFGVGIEIFGAELTVSDEISPSVSIDSVTPSPGTGFQGPIVTTFTATDADAGVKKAELLLDGAPVATREYTASCSFTKIEPCPGAITDRLESPAVSFLQGAHQLSMRVTDAAENTTVVPVPPLANGTPCQAPAMTVTANRRPTAITVPFGRTVLVEGRVACGATPVPGATIAVNAATLGGTPTGPSTVQTGPDGRFRFQLGSGPSRSMSFSYRAYSSEPTPAANAAVKVNVTPRLTLRIKPRHTHDHGKITWTGRVTGGPYPPAGMPLNIQVKIGHKWKTFDEVTIEHGKHGAWEYEYIFKRTSRPTTYAFRVALPRGGDVGYPYTTGASPPVKVHVR